LVFVLLTLIGLVALFTQIGVLQRANYRVVRGVMQKSDILERRHALESYARSWQKKHGVPEGRELEVSIDDRDYVIRFIDVAAFVDLNSSDSEILLKLLMGIGMTEERSKSVVAERDALRKSRQAFASVEHFAIHFGLTASQVQALRGFSTVHSGRRGLSIEHADQKLLEVLCACHNGKIEGEFNSKLNGRNFTLQILDAENGMGEL
jgi:hypothetical protein